MAKKSKKSMENTMKCEQEKWDAESLVKEAFMKTPAAKKAVEETIKANRKQKAAIKKFVEEGIEK